MDTTIAANIALQVGVDNDIDFNLVKDCARAAHLESFILSLPYGYNTIIGEGGSKLSESKTKIRNCTCVVQKYRYTSA